MAWAQQLWPGRWRLLKQPSHVSVEEKQAMTALASEDAGCVQSFRRLLRQLVHIFAHAHRAAHAKLRRHQLSQDSHALGDPQLDTMPQGFADHWEHA
jgi:hypothetical protein